MTGYLCFCIMKMILSNLFGKQTGKSIIFLRHWIFFKSRDKPDENIDGASEKERARERERQREERPLTFEMSLLVAPEAGEWEEMKKRLWKRENLLVKVKVSSLLAPSSNKFKCQTFWHFRPLILMEIALKSLAVRSHHPDPDPDADQPASTSTLSR